LQGKDSDRFP